MKGLITDYNSRKYKVDTQIGRYTILGKKDGRPSDYYCRNNKTNKIVVKASKELKKESEKPNKNVEIVYFHSWNAWGSKVFWDSEMKIITGVIREDKRILNRLESQLKKRLNIELEPEDLELDYIILSAVRSELKVDTAEEVGKIIGADKYFDHHSYKKEYEIEEDEEY